MFRVLSILAAAVALAVSAASASAGTSNSRSVLYNGHAGLGANASTKAARQPSGVANHTEGTISVKWEIGEYDAVRVKAGVMLLHGDFST